MAERNIELFILVLISSRRIFKCNVFVTLSNKGNGFSVIRDWTRYSSRFHVLIFGKLDKIYIYIRSGVTVDLTMVDPDLLQHVSQSCRLTASRPSSLTPFKGIARSFQWETARGIPFPQDGDPSPPPPRQDLDNTGAHTPTSPPYGQSSRRTTSVDGKNSTETHRRCVGPNIAPALQALWKWMVMACACVTFRNLPYSFK